MQEPVSAQRFSAQAGSSLVEVMAAAAVLLIGLLGTFGMVDTSQRMTAKNTSRTAATNLGREILEHARSLDYEQLTPTTLVGQLRARAALTGTLQGDGSWTVQRGNVRVNVAAQVCTADDPMDGLASTPPQNACAAAAAVAGTPAESNPDDYRRVTLTLSWVTAGEAARINQTSLIANPGGGLGPRVTSFPDPFATQVTSGTSVPFTATTTSASTLRWSIDDGISAGDAAGGPTSWTFNWNIGTVGVEPWTLDGTYSINVQPFDSRGVPGERRAATVLLNRRVPLAPANVQGGRSEYGGGVIEIEWSPSRERDVIGYRVYRTNADSLKARLCPPPEDGASAVIKRLSCTDYNPATVPVHNVVAVDRPVLGDPTSGTREGDDATINVGGLGPRPSAPTNLQGSVVGGRVRLTWTAPTGLPPIFYRIYRDGIRIDRTATPSPEWTDAEPSQGNPHTYTVSAVSSSFNESVMSNAVTAG